MDNPVISDVYYSGASSFFDETDEENISLNEIQPSDRMGAAAAQHRQILNIFFLIDVSGSMRGQRIAQVNYALENIIKELRHKDDANSVFKIGIMEFCETASWITPQPVPLDDYVFTKIEAKPWITCFGRAFDALNEKLSRKAFIDENLGEYFAPVILFITDGEPTDFDQYPAALARLNKNGWFRKSAKYAVAVGDEARTMEICKLLSAFTGVEENVRFADEGDALVELIQFIAVRASEVQSTLVSDSGSSSSSIFPDKDSFFSSY